MNFQSALAAERWFLPYTLYLSPWYEPIGFRWANNLKPDDAFEPKLFTGYYDAMGNGAAAL
jgi:hypothetical protein